MCYDMFSHVNILRFKADYILYISRQAFPSAVVCSEPLIYQSRIRLEVWIIQGSDIFYTRGGVMILVLWGQHTDVIIYVKLGNADADTYRFEPMDKILDCWKKMKKGKHGSHYHEQQKENLVCYLC